MIRLSLDRDMSNEIQFLLYNLPEDDGKVQVIIKDDTIWCTQKAMSQLFGVDTSGISRHLSNIFDSGELESSRSGSESFGFRSLSSHTTVRAVRHTAV